MAWRVNKSKAGGWNIRWDDIPQLIRAKLASKFNELKGTQYLKLATYSYRRFGDQAEMLARYATKPSAPTTPSETGTKPSPAPIERILVEPWKLKRVPSLKDFDPKLTLQSVMQKRLFGTKDKTKTVGMMNYVDTGEEVALVPSHPIPLNIPPLQSFLLNSSKTGLLSMKLKHVEEGFDFRPEIDESGQLLTAVLIRGSLPRQLKEIADMAAWAFEASEEKKP